MSQTIPYSTTAGQPTRTKTTPIEVPRSIRRIEHRVLTSFKAGFGVPVVAIPLLREDAATRVDLTFSFDMAETVEMLVNAVYARVLTYLVPWSAFERFDGMDQFNRSYMKQPQIDGGSVVPFIRTAAFADDMSILKKLGVHARVGQTINIGYIEAYNEIYNMRARNRSPDLAMRATDDKTLAKAFWMHQLWANVVPDFDQASIEGEVPLKFTADRVPVSGIASATDAAPTHSNGGRTLKQTPPLPDTPSASSNWTHPVDANRTNQLLFRMDGAATHIPQIFAELEGMGVSVSLANIDMARRTQAFALMRKQYNGLEDAYIMDLLMSGITVPDQDLRAPILLSDKMTVFGMNKRYSTTADDLTASVTNGGTFLNVTVRTPRIHTGGIIMSIVEVTPEQLFERQEDPYVRITDQNLYPEFIRDTLDPEKVDIVEDQEVDIQHDTPTQTFGYTFLNGKWARSRSRIGGKFYRPDPDGAFDEDRQRIWAVETQNPTLSADFYLCGTVNTKPFVDQTTDQFEVVVRGNTEIQGNTVFGRPLIEGSDDYNAIMDYVPDDPYVPDPAAMEALKVVPPVPPSESGPDSAAAAGGQASGAAGGPVT